MYYSNFRSTSIVYRERSSPNLFQFQRANIFFRFNDVCILGHVFILPVISFCRLHFFHFGLKRTHTLLKLQKRSGTDKRSKTIKRSRSGQEGKIPTRRWKLG